MRTWHIRRFLNVACIAIGAAPSIGLAQIATAENAVIGRTLVSSSLRMLLSLGVVLALVVFFAWLMKRMRERQTTQNSSIEIISGITLGTRERVVLLKVGDEQVLVGVSPAGMRSLHVVKHTPSKSSFDLSLGAPQ